MNPHQSIADELVWREHHRRKDRPFWMVFLFVVAGCSAAGVVAGWALAWLHR